MHWLSSCNNPEREREKVGREVKDQMVILKGGISMV